MIVNEGFKNGLALSTIDNINNINNHKSSSSLVDPATTLQQRQHRPVSLPTYQFWLPWDVLSFITPQKSPASSNAQETRSPRSFYIHNWPSQRSTANESCWFLEYIRSSLACQLAGATAMAMAVNCLTPYKWWRTSCWGRCWIGRCCMWYMRWKISTEVWWALRGCHLNTLPYVCPSMIWLCQSHHPWPSCRLDQSCACPNSWRRRMNCSIYWSVLEPLNGLSVSLSLWSLWLSSYLDQ